MFEKIFWIGGSPCSGKSTIAEKLRDDFNFEYYKCDDHLDRYIEIGSEEKKEIMIKFKNMNLDQTWLLRSIDEQVRDELVFYREAINIIIKDLEENYSEKSVVVEGAAILPEVIEKLGIDSNRYICMVPTKEFQLENYRKRDWVKYYLSECSDPERAFYNWMERDAEFSKIVMQHAVSNNSNIILVDGLKTIEENYVTVKKMFGLI